MNAFESSTNICSVWIDVDDLHSLQISTILEVDISLSGTAWAKENCYGGFRAWDPWESKEFRQCWTHTLRGPRCTNRVPNHIVPVVKSWCLHFLCSWDGSLNCIARFFFARSAKKSFVLFWFGSSLSVTCRLKAPRNLWALWVLAARMYCNTNEFSSDFFPPATSTSNLPLGAFRMEHQVWGHGSRDSWQLSLAVRIQLILRSRCKKSSD